MAATTVTAASYDVGNCRNIHEGNYSVYFKFEYSAGKTVSAGDTVLLGYIPQGVTVIDAYVWGLFADTTNTFKLGTQASISALGTTTSITSGGMNRMVGFLPRTFSLSSDADGNLRVPIAAKRVAGTSTATGSLNVLLILTNSPVIS